jgi:diguanylate cyclase (GGDEF)-like protein
MAATNLFLIIIDLMTWYFNGRPGHINLIAAKIVNILVYSLQPLPSALFVLYVYELISIGNRQVKRLKPIIYVILIVNAVLSFLSAFTGWYYYIDTNNIYNRGRFFYIHEFLCIILMVYSIYVVIINRHKFQKRYFIALLLFCVPVITGVIVQTLFYGYTAILMGMTLSLLIVYISIQLRNLNTDYLTGVSNRRYLDEYLAGKINRSKKRSFSVIMIDIDAFKLINDNFGHETGDMALKDTVSILKSSLSKDDFIARMGGDEFFIIIDVDSQQALLKVVDNIKQNIAKFNAYNNRPYNISFSFGFSVYDWVTGMSAGEFIAYVDKLMYKDKRRKT